jgi:Fe-S-cluster containining protein
VKTCDEAGAAKADHATLETLKQDPNEADAAAGRQCGDCSMCCKTLPIDEISKPAHQWCQHARPGSGCAIYETRPAVCRGFACTWLVSKDLKPHWKPTKCKMVLHTKGHERGGGVMMVQVDRDYPNAWRRSPYYEELKAWCRRIKIEIVVSERCRVEMCPDQDVYFERDRGGWRVISRHRSSHL